MALDLVATAPEELGDVSRFLLEVFGLRPDHPFVEERTLRWKYFAPHPFWVGSRSYTLRKDGKIVAHGCVVPSRFSVQDRTITAIRLIDWAGGRAVPGAGILLMRRIGEMADVILAVGGSEDTLKVLPKSGFERRKDAAVYAQVVRPWRQFRTDPFPRGWKAPVRLARNTVWSWSRLPDPPAGWSAVPMKSFRPEDYAWASTSPGAVHPERNADLLNYMLACPAASVSGFIAQRGNTPRGFFLLSHVAGQTRLAEVRSTESEDLGAVYRLAAQTAAKDSRTCEVVAMAPTSIATSCIEHAGLRYRLSQPVLTYDRARKLVDISELDVNMLEGDEAFLVSPDYPYLT